MCGIVGTLNISKSFNLDLISHRGPDDRGTFKYENVNLGHVRLSIQDLSERGHQPFVSFDNNFIIVFNGEIYNHWEIRQELEKLGHRFLSSSDTETVLIGYMEWGEKIIPKLNGIFAFSILDKTKKQLIIARDRFGVKPLYYFFVDNSIGFSSELKALIDLVPIGIQLNEEALASYIRFLWCPGEDTPVKEIKKLLPGRYIKIDVNNPESFEIVQFYKAGFNSKYLHSSENEILDQLDNFLTQAVKRQLLSDVPVGFFLSGGLDSSLLVAIAKKILPDKKIQCFTIETDQEHSANTNDLYFAKEVAKYLHVDLEIINSPVEIVNDFDKMIFHLDEPQADAAPLNVLNISRRAREMGYKVLIGGTAGDDIFSGYRRHQALRFSSFFDVLPHFLIKALVGIFANIQTFDPRIRRLKKVVNTLVYKGNDRIFSLFEWLDADTVFDLFNDKIKSRLNAIDKYSYFKKVLAEIPLEKNPLNQMLYLEMNSFLVDHNLNYTDKMGMAVGVEIRVPYLDNDLVDFSYVIPPELKMRGNQTKYILKRLAERYLPHHIIYRDKTGFGAPVRKWVTGDLSARINDRLSKNTLEKHNIFNHKKITELIQKNKEYKIDASYSIWALLAIESWLELFLKGNCDLND